jgi:hypothetical protein
MLSWSATNASSCTALGGWSGSQPMSGNASTGALTNTTTYTLTCSGTGGSASQSITVNVSSVPSADGSSCSASSGGLTLQAKAVRTGGISPMLVFFDATGTADIAIAGTTFQHVFYTWNFGDTGVSGTGSWAYGSNAEHNSKNAAIGAVAAHLYITNGADSSYPVTVTAYDGTSAASCSLGVMAYDPSGSNGFPRSATTCVAVSAKPVAGAGGCPAGARVVWQSNMGTALSSAFGSGKRVLFRCGDTFTGTYGVPATINKASIGAYGGCENTTTGRPIFQNFGGTTLNFISNNPTDIRVSDIDFEDGTRSAQAIGNTGQGMRDTQVTLYNLNCSGLNSCFYLNEVTQSGIIQSTVTGLNNGYGIFWNYAENNCLNGSNSANCGGTPVYNPVTYNALMGNSVNGQGEVSPGPETVRLSACRFCVIANNTFQNSSANWGAVLKIHSGNTWLSQATWIGQYTEYLEVSDNFITGTSGSQIVELAPQSNAQDERLRYIVFERNLIRGTGASKTLISAVKSTARNNVFYVVSGNTNISDFSMQISQRGVEPAASAVEIYNNTCYALTTQSGCAGFIRGDGANAAGINSRAGNNLFYNNGTGSAAVVNNGTGNTVSNNTANSAANPLLSNASGSFSVISDFQPTQNFSGGAEVPVWYDALGVAWSPIWSLGALKPATGVNGKRLSAVAVVDQAD